MALNYAIRRSRQSRLLAKLCNRREPSVPHWLTPNAFLQRQTVSLLTPNQC